MENHAAVKCQSCGGREQVLRAVYDWQRTQANGAWVWLGTARALCARCFDDPRLRARWIDERKKQTPAKPSWAKDEPEEFAPTGAKTPASAAEPAASASRANLSVVRAPAAARNGHTKRKAPAKKQTKGKMRAD